MTAVIFNIARSSLHDGDGLRTVVYFKGCLLRCRWCHNPEGYSPNRQIMYMPNRCVGCGRCADICPACHIVSDGKIHFIRRGCVSCFKCADVCPNGSLSVCGEFMTVDSIFDEAVKDRDYYEATGGGVTLSGGECLLYPEFCGQLLEKCKQAGIHTAVETSLSVPWESAAAVLPAADTILADIKHIDPEIHKRFTGHDSRTILDNLKALSEIHPDIWIRIPLIPGINDGENTVKRIARYVNTLGNGVKRVEILKYNNLSRGKHAALGLPENETLDLAPQDDSAMKRIGRILEETLKPGLRVIY